MSWIEDARKLLQDFVAPELRGINQRLDDVVGGLEKQFAEVERLAQDRQQASEKAAQERQQILERSIQERQQASDKAAQERHQALEVLMTERFTAAEKLASEREKAMLDRMEALHRELMMAIDLAIAHRRIEELEGQKQRAS